MILFEPHINTKGQKTQDPLQYWPYDTLSDVQRWPCGLSTEHDALRLGTPCLRGDVYMAKQLEEMNPTIFFRLHIFLYVRQDCPML